jgi:hypothetical protein
LSNAQKRILRCYASAIADDDYRSLTRLVDPAFRAPPISSQLAAAAKRGPILIVVEPIADAFSYRVVMATFAGRETQSFGLESPGMDDNWTLALGRAASPSDVQSTTSPG